MNFTHETLTQLALRLHADASTDALTGLPNRRSAFQHLDSISFQQVTLAVIDLDHFKSINDTYGHDVGDEVLKHAATILQECAEQAGGSVYRVGGEEFLAVLPFGSSPLSLSKWCERLARTPVSVGDRLLQITMSVGVSQGVLAVRDQLLGAADAACYSAKNGGRNRVCVAASETADDLSQTRFRTRPRDEQHHEYIVAFEDGTLRSVRATSPLCAVRSLREALSVVGWLQVLGPDGRTEGLFLAAPDAPVVDFSPWAEGLAQAG